MNLPTMITLLRFPIALMMIVDAWDRSASPYFLALFGFGAVTDFLDGFLARRMKLTSVSGARLDSLADIIFYLSCFVSSWLIFPSVIQQYWSGWILVIAAQLVSWGFCLIKFRKLTSYHTLSAKIWGVTLVVGFGLFFGWGNHAMIPVIIVLGILSNLEDILITAVIPYWKSDVLSIVHARKFFPQTKV